MFVEREQPLTQASQIFHYVLESRYKGLYVFTWVGGGEFPWIEKAW